MPPPHHDRAAASAIALVLDPARLDRILAPWLADADERAFVVRCILGEGPIHHRAASYAILAVAGAIAERLGATAPADLSAGVTVPMRLPPHLAVDGGEPAYPLHLDPGALAPVSADAGVLRVLTDAVTDGPPHHGLANVALLNLLAAIDRRLAERA